MDCTAASTRRHAAANHHHAAAHGQGGQVLGLAQRGDEGNRILHAVQLLARHAELVRAAQAHAQKQGVVALTQCVELGHAFQRPAATDLDAANVQQPLHFALGKVVRRLVTGQTVFIEAAGFGVGVEHHHRMAETRQCVGAGQAGWAGPHHRHFFAAGGGAGEQLRADAFQQRVHRVTLQAANRHRLALLRVAHAHRLAQVLGRADPRAHAAQRVGFQNGAGRAAQVAVGDALDERRHLNVGRAGGGAGRVVAIQAALGFQHGLRRGQARRRIGKTLGVRQGRQTAGTNIGRGGRRNGIRHAGNSLRRGLVTTRSLKADRLVSL